MPRLDELARRWAEIEPVLARATRYTDGCYEPIDVLRQAMAGIVGFWLIEERGEFRAVCVVELRPTPRKRVLVANFIAGRGLRQWWPLLLERLDAVARENGCASVACYGRPGWVRFLKSRGDARHIASEVMVRALQ